MKNPIKIKRPGVKGQMDQIKDTPEAALLNPAQKRSLTVALRLLEERLNEIEAILAGEKNEGILFSIENDLSSQQTEGLRVVFEEIRKRIVRAKMQFALTAESEKLSQIVAGSTSYFWSILADKTARKMSRYGTVSSHLSRVLDPIVLELDGLLNEIRNILQSSK